MFKEKINENNLLLDIYKGDSEKLYKRIREEIEAGTFEKESDSFARNIIGSECNAISPTDFRICQNEIKKITTEIEDEEERKRGETIKESGKFWEEEDARGSNVEWR